jgi:NCAIR mutase (PurE)-related protein
MTKRFNIDHTRKERLGFDEVIYGAAKSISLMTELLNEYTKRGENVLVTKLQVEKATVLMGSFPNAFYDEASEVFMLSPIGNPGENHDVGIISAGSSDEGVANEAYYTLQYMGANPNIVHDVGVAGIHRLMDRLEELKTYEILIVVAGFEGALPTVVGGLLPQPIIAVPTSVGYGSAKNGETALNAMLTSCANGISVTNIDNGYGAAMCALRILNLKSS